MNPEELLKMSEDTLLTMREEWKKEGRHLLELSGKAEWEVMRRMRERDAKVVATDNWDGELKVGARTYSYDLPLLEQLKALLRPGEWETVINERMVVEIDKRHLNKLAERGGMIAEVIGKATITHEGDTKLTVKRRELEEPA